MPLYESTFIVRQDLSPADVEKIMDQFSAILKEEGGRVVKKEYWGLRTLAYRINKSRKGHYFLLGVDAPAAAVQEMARKARISEDVMRNLTVRVEAISKEPSAPMQQDRAA